MNALLLTSEKALASQVKNILSGGYFEVKFFDEYLKVIEEFYEGASYDVYVIHCTATTHGADVAKILKGGLQTAPIILIYDALCPKVLTDCNDFLKRELIEEELLYRIFHMCNLNEEKSYTLCENMKFNPQNSSITTENECIVLGKKEGKLLELIAQCNPNVATFSEIEDYIWNNEGSCGDKIRSLARQLRSKLPTNIIQTVKGVGYKLNSYT